MKEAVPPDEEFEGRVGESLEVSQSFELLPHSDDAFDESSVLLLLHITQLTSVSDDTGRNQESI